jgi:hypothetical protein
MGLTAERILDLYERRGPGIFGQAHRPMLNLVLRKARLARWAIKPKYDSERLRDALREVLGDRKIGHASRRLMIPAWNPALRSVYIYKTAHHERLRTDYKSDAVDAALATAAAPTYFRQHVTKHDVGLVDGGVWANNPIGLAVVEAVTLLGWPPDSLHVLSLGCLDEAYTIRPAAGFGTLGLKAIKLFMNGQSRGAMGIAKLLTGHEHRRHAIHRIDHVVPSGKYGMDDAKVIRELKGMGFAMARDRFPVLRDVFFDTPADPFEPFYRLDAATA